MAFMYSMWQMLTKDDDINTSLETDIKCSITTGLSMKSSVVQGLHCVLLLYGVIHLFISDIEVILL